MARYANNSLERGIRLLETLGMSGEPQTLTDIAAATGLARSTAFRLLAVLRELGFVHKNPADGLYTLGYNAYRLGQTSRAVEALIRDARPFIRKLAHDSAMTTYLAALEGPQILICDIVQPPDGLKLPFEVGVRIDAHANAAGKALFAARQEAEISPYFATHAPRRYTSHTLASFDALRRELREVSRKGYATERGDMRSDLEAVALPVTSKLDRPIQAIVTVGHVGDEAGLPFQRRLDQMRRAVAEFYDFRVIGEEPA